MNQDFGGLVGKVFSYFCNVLEMKKGRPAGVLNVRDHGERRIKGYTNIFSRGRLDNDIRPKNEITKSVL